MANVTKINGYDIKDSTAYRIYSSNAVIKTAGGYRICTISNYGGSALISLSGHYNYTPPTPVTLLVSFGGTTAKIKQIGPCSYVGGITKARVVATSTTTGAVDVYVSTSSDGNEYQATIMNLGQRGDITAVNFTAASGTATDVCTITTGDEADLLGVDTRSSIGAETISLDLTPYNYVIVGGFAGGTTEYCEAICPVGQASMLQYIGFNTGVTSSVQAFLNTAQRGFSVSTTGVTFGNGTMTYQGSVYINGESRMVPYYIGGVKR